MRTFKIVDDDIVFDSRGNIVMIEGKDEEVQSIERLLTTNTGEWFLNVEHGLEYSKIQGKGVTDEQIRLAFTKAIAQEPRVARVDNVTVERNNRDRTIKVAAICTMKSGNAVEVVKEIG